MHGSILIFLFGALSFCHRDWDFQKIWALWDFENFGYSLFLSLFSPLIWVFLSFSMCIGVGNILDWGMELDGVEKLGWVERGRAKGWQVYMYLYMCACFYLKSTAQMVCI